MWHIWQPTVIYVLPALAAILRPKQVRMSEVGQRDQNQIRSQLLGRIDPCNLVTGKRRAGQVCAPSFPSIDTAKETSVFCSHVNAIRVARGDFDRRDRAVIENRRYRRPRFPCVLRSPNTL